MGSPQPVSCGPGSFGQEVTAAASGREAIAAFVRGNAAILVRAAGLDAVAKSVPHEPDAVAVVAASEELRRSSQGEVVVMLDERFGLRPDLPLDMATDVFVALCGTELYLVLQRSGWAHEAYVDWLTDTLAEQLLAQPGTRGGVEAARSPREGS